MKSFLLSALLLPASFGQPLPEVLTTFEPIVIPGLQPQTTAAQTTVAPVAPVAPQAPATTPGAPATISTTLGSGHPVLPRPSTEAPVAPITTVPAAPVAPVAPAGFAYGAFGQLCEVTSRWERYKCQSNTDVFTDINGFAICERAHSCCQCAEITCGLGATLCEEIAFGPMSAKYVGNIQVVGNVDYGAVVSCNGLEACLGSTITGTKIGAIDCDGARACQFAKFLITDPADHFVIECGGASACEGLSIEIIFSGPPPGYMCAWQANAAYAKKTWTIAGIECASAGACSLMDVTINNEVGCRSVVVEYIECLANEACTGASFDLLGDVTITECACGTSCSTATGLGSCYTPALPIAP